MELDPNAWLMGGGKTPGISWRDVPVGTTVTGTVARECKMMQQRDPETNDALYWDEARTQPKMQLVVYIQTGERDPSIEDDDGVRALYVKGKSMTEGMREAVKRSGRKGIEVGGTVTVRYVGEGERTKKVYNPPKLYEVHYRPPADAASTAFFDPATVSAAGSSPATVQPYGSPVANRYGGTATMTAPSGVAVAAQAGGGIPAGFDPAQWATLDDSRRAQILNALTNTAPPF